MSESDIAQEPPWKIKCVGVLCILGGCKKIVGGIMGAYALRDSSHAMMAYISYETALSALLMIALGVGCLKFKHWARVLIISLALIDLPDLISAFPVFMASFRTSQQTMGSYAVFIMASMSSFFAAQIAVFAVVASLFLSKPVHAAFRSRGPANDWSDRFEFAPLVILVWLIVTTYGAAKDMVVSHVLPVHLGTATEMWRNVENIATLVVGILGIIWMLQGRLRRTWWLLMGAAFVSVVYAFSPESREPLGDLKSAAEQISASLGGAQKLGEKFSEKVSFLSGVLGGIPLWLTSVLSTFISATFLVLTRNQFLRGRGRGGPAPSAQTPAAETQEFRRILHAVAWGGLALMLLSPIAVWIMKNRMISRLAVEFDVGRLPASADRDLEMRLSAGVIKRRLTEDLQSLVQFEAVGPAGLRIGVRGVSDLEKLKTMVSRPGVLEFRPLDDSPAAKEILAKIGNDLKSSASIPKGETLMRDKNGWSYLARRPIPLTSSDIKDAVVSALSSNGKFCVLVHFNSHGTDILARQTTANVGKRMALVLDGLVYIAPEIKGPITEGSLIIEGEFSREELRDLAIVLGAGPLPVPVKSISDAN